MNKMIFVIAAIALTGCGNPDLGRIMFQTPSGFDEEQRQTFETLPLLSQGSELGVCSHIRINRAQTTQADREVYRAALNKRGLSRRDAEIVTSTSADFGTGMTYAGLECSADGRLATNKAFYTGLGHRWQVRFGNSFVYLEGDGTPSGMIVTAWN
jgi:hypothetical protein